MADAVDLIGIEKTFHAVPALKSARFSAAWGEVHALLGENGAGKSTLMNVLAGLYAPDGGRIRIDGREARIGDPAAARALRIGMVHQHYQLVASFSVTDNVLLANPRPWRHARTALATEIEALCKRVGFALDPAAVAASLSIAEQQRVEIVKALLGGARILILDEPTAVLTDAEARSLLETVRRLADAGTCVILVTHKLGEVQRYADRVTVMRAGRTMAQADPRSMSIAEIARLMIGEDLATPPRGSRSPGATRLRVSELRAARSDGLCTVNGVSFSVRAGEIYGIAGVGGNGQTELAEVLMGVRQALAGTADLDGQELLSASPWQRRRRGLAAIPADRRRYGLAGSLSIADNFIIGQIRSGSYGGWGWVRGRAMRMHAARAMRDFDIHGVDSVDRSAALLSGGNAQKLVIAREFAGTPGVILAHSPSRGLDVRACAAVHDRLRQACDRGAAVVLISEDLDEVLALADRVGVINRGRILAEFAAPVQRQDVGNAMVGHA